MFLLAGSWEILHAVGPKIIYILLTRPGLHSTPTVGFMILHCVTGRQQKQQQHLNICRGTLIAAHLQGGVEWSVVGRAPSTVLKNGQKRVITTRKNMQLFEGGGYKGKLNFLPHQ